MSSNPAYMKVYMKRRYRERRVLAIETLGGKCARCPETSDLEVDHKDPSKKTMDFSQMFGCGMTRFMKELALCQLLCRKCHNNKTVIEDLGRSFRTHGSLGMYQHSKCRCDLCKGAKTAHHRAYRERKKKQRDASISGDAPAS